MRAANTAVKIAKCTLMKIREMIGRNKTLKMAARDTYLKKDTNNIQSPRAASARGQLNAIRIPSPVATPLPPLKSSHTGKKCPKRVTIAIEKVRNSDVV